MKLLIKKFESKKIFFQKTKGFMMLEVLLVASIMTLSVLAVMSVAQKSIYVSRLALDATAASFLLEEGAEVVRILRDDTWNNISSLSTSTDYYADFSGGWTLSLTPNTLGMYTRKIRFENVNRNDTTDDIVPSGTNDPNSRFVTVTVTWTNGGNVVNKTLSFYIFDIFS